MDKDEEKDLFIKSKIKDGHIPEKIDELFNNSIKLEENKLKGNKKQKLAKWVAGIAACTVIALGGGNIYATTQGYDNVFFMIKELFYSEISVSGKDKILSDRDITISYKQIQIATNLKVTIKELQVKDGVAKLFIKVNEVGEVDSTIVPLKYKIYNDSDKLLSEKESSKDDENIGFYTEEIEIKDYNNENIINLEIDKSNGSKITTIKINLDEKTIEVQGEKEELNKISEIELKEFLGYEASMECSHLDRCTDTEGTKVLAVNEFLAANQEQLEQYNLKKKELYGVIKASVADQVAKEVFGETIGTMKKNNGIYITYIENGVKYYGMEEPSDIYIGGNCINISDISYCAGVYTTTFTYSYLPDVPDGDYDVNDLAIYQNTVNFKYDENNKYSKFLIISRENATLVKAENVKEEGTVKDENVSIPENNEESTNAEKSNKDNSTTNNKTDNVKNNNTSSNTSNVNNYASTMSWTDYWAPGIKFKYPTIFNLEEIGGSNRGSMPGEVTTKITGVATGINPDTKEILNSNLTIKIYEPFEINEDIDKYLSDNGLDHNCYTKTNSGLIWYEKTYINDKGEAVPYLYTNIEEINNGRYAVYKIEFESDLMENYKVINIINWLLGSTKTTSY